MAEPKVTVKGKAARRMTTDCILLNKNILQIISNLQEILTEQHRK